MDSRQRPGSRICTDISPQNLHWNATNTSTNTSTNTTTNNVKHLPRN
jgi:hypothetical protein